MEGFLDKKFGRYSDGVKAEYLPKYLPWKEKKEELEGIVDTWDFIWGELQPFIRDKEPVERALKESGAPVSCGEIGKTKADAMDTILNARYIRGRYTLLDLLADFGVLERAARAVLD